MKVSSGCHYLASINRRLIGSIAATCRRVRLVWRGLAHADLIPTATTPNERDELFALSTAKAGGIAVEIGSACGSSSCFIAAGIRPRGGVLYCVDRWNVEYREEGNGVVCYLYGDSNDLKRYEWDPIKEEVVFRTVKSVSAKCPTYDLFMENTHDFSDVIRVVRHDSLLAAKQFSGSIDFLFIDGWHEYHGVKGDTDAWLPKVRSGGIVVYHDSGWAPGVQRVIEEDVLPRAISHVNLSNMFWAVLQ
jgi:predicted O-methyltransferase YrrM